MSKLNVAAMEGVVLAEADMERAREVYPGAVKKFLHAERENVVGVGIGHKWVNGLPTAEACIQVYVRKKVRDPNELPAGATIQETVGGVKTDVIEVGEITFDSLTDKVRPLEIGYSVGAQFEDEKHTGTLGAFVTKVIDGVPHYFVLSCNHVLGANNGFLPGTMAMQPGPKDGGGADAICAQLWRYVPKSKASANTVDAAMAAVHKEMICDDRPYVVTPQKDVAPGLNVRKTGRTTGLTEGRIIATDVTIKVKSSSGVVYEMTDQLKASYPSAGGDSGALVIASEGNKPVGLHFAGSDDAAFLNRIENVLTALGVALY
ncbi:hypothetical protein ACR42D_02540 [Desulfovibrio caledoniensis]